MYVNHNNATRHPRRGDTHTYTCVGTNIVINSYRSSVIFTAVRYAQIKSKGLEVKKKKSS